MIGKHCFAAFCALVMLFLLGAGCGPRTDRSDGRISVAVSVLPEKWLVDQLTGGKVEVTTLVLPGDNPHTYQPSDAQVSRLMRSAVFFRMGVPFEHGPWFQAIEKSSRLKIVDLRQGLELLDMGEHAHHHEEQGPAGHHDHDEEGEGGKDPHTWLSVRSLKIQAATMARALGEVDPAHKADYDQRLADLQRRLDALDAELRAKLAPLKGKSFFVFHPAWGYFAHDYQLRQVAIEVEGKDPTDRELTEIQRQARESGAKVILVQPQISGRGAEAVATTVGARVVVADPLAENVPDTLVHVADVLAKSF
jgi:zinc transport system substrate-binding protein